MYPLLGFGVGPCKVLGQVQTTYLSSQGQMLIDLENIGL